MQNDEAYANAAFIPRGDTYPSIWQARGAAFIRRHPPEMVAAGAAGAERALFWRGGARLLVFVHGGYWLRFSPGSFAHLAEGALQAGWSVAMPAYPLAPAARVSAITRSVAQSLTRLCDLVDGPVHLAGHSAGGHLVARMLAPGMLPDPVAARIARVVPISPVSDLAPLLQTSMNADLQLDEDEAAAESPCRQPRPAVPVHVWVGGDERPVFLDQARRLAEAWRCPLTIDMGKHHFDVIEGLERPSALLSAVIG